MKIQTVFYYTVKKQKHNRFTRATKPIKYLELSVMRNVHEKKLTKFWGRKVWINASGGLIRMLWRKSLSPN